MFSVTLVFGSVSAMLLYKTKEAAESTLAAYHAGDKTTTWEGAEFSAADDFGMRVSIKRNALHGVLFDDLTQSKMALVERSLHQARTQVLAEQMGEADPVLRAANTRRNSNAMLTPGIPGFNGAFRQ